MLVADDEPFGSSFHKRIAINEERIAKTKLFHDFHAFPFCQRADNDIMIPFDEDYLLGVLCKKIKKSENLFPFLTENAAKLMLQVAVDNNRFWPYVSKDAFQHVPHFFKLKPGHENAFLLQRFLIADVQIVDDKQLFGFPPERQINTLQSFADLHPVLRRRNIYKTTDFPEPTSPGSLRSEDHTSQLQ